MTYKSLDNVRYKCILMTNIYKLEFEVDNPCNTTIFDKDSGTILYEVVTEHGKETVTRVKNGVGDTIASWVWRDTRSDIITLGNGTPVSVGTWLKKSLLPFKDTVVLQDFSGRSYKWKGNAPGLTFELYSEDNKKEPLVRFVNPRKSWDFKVRPPTSTIVEPAYLVMDERGKAIQDIAVISFLVLEKSRRMRERSTGNRAEVEATAAAAGVGAGLVF